MNGKPVIAIVGATGAVGVELLQCLERRNFPVGEIRLLASARSRGKRLPFHSESVAVEELNESKFDGIDIAFFSAGGKISREFVPKAVQRGAVVIDNSSAFRMDPTVPLVIPEINPEAIGEHRGIIANPNCSTIIAITPLWPIHRVNRIRRLIITTYQAASGAGAAAMRELVESTRAYLNNQPYQAKVLPHSYAFNLFSHNSKIDAHSGYNEEEIKIIKETAKIMHDQEIRVTATCVRVPVLRAHSESLLLECEAPITPDEVRSLLREAPGIRIVDRAEENYFPMPLDASGQDEILAGRIRQDLSDPSGRSIALFVCGDQLLKGAALNAIQIAEYLVSTHRELASKQTSSAARL
ncbi:MAG: aspartate-semialdehyde dehydrogenase [Acidobacteria bacterium]|nr:aspartate-semialdehyde dehydrogenase [Acidobacteriota bacterium]